jgi:hypothetical protein
MIDLEKDTEITPEQLYQLFEYTPEYTGYCFIVKYFCNTTNTFGHIFERISDKKLFFIENYSLDSWFWGEGFNSDMDGVIVFDAEKVYYENFILYELTNRRKLKIIS